MTALGSHIISPLDLSALMNGAAQSVPPKRTAFETHLQILDLTSPIAGVLLLPTARQTAYGFDGKSLGDFVLYSAVAVNREILGLSGETPLTNKKANDLAIALNENAYDQARRLQGVVRWQRTDLDLGFLLPDPVTQTDAAPAF